MPITIRVSHYWPKLGGTNCSNFVNGECVSRMASGLRWQEYINYAIACPPEWPFYTKLIVNEQEWICLDRGGAIQYVDGVPWVDFLTPNGFYPHGTIVDAILIQP